MGKNAKDNKQVLIMVRRGRRDSFFVEVAGSGDPYPCMTAEDIGETIIEIMNDPKVTSASFESAAPGPEPEPDRPKREKKAKANKAPPKQEAKSNPFQASPEFEDLGLSATDELTVNLISKIIDKARQLSDR
jgi:hypothetical protein